MLIGATIREIRRRMNFKQTEVAKAIGIPVGTYNSYETKGAMPSVETLIRLALFFGTDVNTLVGFDDEQNPEKKREKHKKEALLNLLKAERIIVCDLINELEKCEENKK